MNPQAPPPVTSLPVTNKPSRIPLILGGLLLLALIFGGWAFSSRQSIKSNADKKVAIANQELAKAQADETAADAANKAPYKTFTGPATSGSVSFNYPKSWGAYVDETDNNEPVDGYFYPGIVPGIQSGTAFALRVELVNSDYSTVLNQYEPSVQDGSLKASAYLPPKMKKVSGAQVGTRLDGVIGQDSNDNNINGSVVILKVRDQTLSIYTQSTSYLKDFNSIVLAGLTFKP